MTREQREELLEKPSWVYTDIMLYCDCGKTKSYEIMKICKEQFNGSVRFNTHAVRRDSVLAYCGTDIEREKYIVQQLKSVSTTIDDVKD